MDVVLIVFIAVAVLAVVGGLFAGRRSRQGPEPRFEGEGHSGGPSEPGPDEPDSQ